MRERRGWAFSFAIALVKPLLVTFTRHDWVGGEKIPVDGGAVLVANHVSHLDPLTFAHFVHDNGRMPRFLGKEGLFRVPVVGTILRGAGQIPVYRESSTAAKAFSAAVEAVQHGECVVIYPEATLTRDPDMWPMKGKTGAARVALLTGAPVIPIAQWGPQEVLPPYTKRIRLFPRKTMRMIAGPPVDLSEFAGRDLDADVLHEVTEKIMSAIAELLGEIRGEQPPAVRFDPRASELPRTGDPGRTDGPERRSA
jgi:1-acyl-sn-glycerol-3-phosphate acyltransferase